MDKAGFVKAAMAAIADEYERVGDKKIETYVRSRKSRYTRFMLYPVISLTTAKASRWQSA